MAGVMINRQELVRLLDDFNLLTGIRISYWTADGVKFAASPREGNSPFCEMIRSNPELDQRCRRCDQQALATAARLGRLHTYRCCAGMDECVCPAVHDQTLLGYFMIGQVRLEPGGDEVLRRNEPLFVRSGLNMAELNARFDRLPILTTEKMEAAARMLVALAGYIHLNGLIRRRELPLLERVEDYIRRGLSQPMTLTQAARAVHVSRSTLCHTLRREWDTTFITLVNHLRMQEAARRITGGATVTEAALAVGITSPGYFSKLFRNFYSMSPAAYRQNIGSPDGEDERMDMDESNRN